MPKTLSLCLPRPSIVGAARMRRYTSIEGAPVSVCVDFYGALCRELLPSPAVTVTADTRRVAAKGAWLGEQKRVEGEAVEAKLSGEGGGAGGDLCIHSYLHLSSAASVCVFCAHILLLYFRCGCG